MAFDTDSHLDFVTGAGLDGPGPLGVGQLDSSGSTIGTVVPVGLAAGAIVVAIHLQPGGQNGVWLAYDVAGPLVTPWVARAVPRTGQLAGPRQVATQGSTSSISVTRTGNLKLLIGGAAMAEATTSNAQLAAPCSDGYFVVLSRDAQVLYASYAPASGFDFATQNVPATPPAPAIGCFGPGGARTTGLYGVPGELITIVGGNFGPSAAVTSALGEDGKYPLVAAGVSVKIGGIDAPVLGVARGTIVAQVPYELAPLADSGRAASVAVTLDGAPLNTILMRLTGYGLTLFDNGVVDTVSRLPFLRAMNQDGSVNSAANPALAGSVVSLFGTGAGILSPPLATGEVSPAAASTSAFYAVCYGCNQVLYLGSAPGLSTGVAQINVALGGVPGSVVATQRIGVALTTRLPVDVGVGPSGVIYVR